MARVLIDGLRETARLPESEEHRQLVMRARLACRSYSETREALRDQLEDEAFRRLDAAMYSLGELAWA